MDLPPKTWKFYFYNPINALDGDGDPAWVKFAAQLETENAKFRDRIAELEKWKRTVEDEAVISWCYNEHNKDDPRQMLKDIITNNVAWALDPAISSDAQALIERGRQESKERIAELEDQRSMLLDDIAEHIKAREDLRARIAELEAGLRAAKWFLSDKGRQSLPRDYSPETERMYDDLNKAINP